jgi:hypothetical protein
VGWDGKEWFPGGKVVGWKEEGCWGKFERRAGWEEKKKKKKKKGVCALGTPW